MSYDPQHVRELHKGEPVEIIGTMFASHAHMIGRRGLVHRYIKSRQVYVVAFTATGQRWESCPHNLRAVNDGAVGYGRAA